MSPNIQALRLNTNLSGTESFPPYLEQSPLQLDIMASAIPPRNKALGNVQIDSAESSRRPSPQPTHFSGPILSHSNGNGHRVLRSATVGYVAPEFLGKVEQMKQGMCCDSPLLSPDTNTSQSRT
jgi:glutamate dehydrogenase